LYDGTRNHRLKIGAAKTDGPPTELYELDFSVKNPSSDGARLKAEEGSGLAYGQKVCLVLHRQEPRFPNGFPY